MESHGGAHLGQVVVHLAVGKPVDGHPEEDTASAKATADFVNPSIVKVVPRGLVGAKRRRLDGIPALALLPVLDGLNRVSGHTEAKSLEEELESRSQDTTAGRRELVLALAEDQDRDGQHEEDEGNQESEVEADITFSKDHAKLTKQGTPVDEPVEPVVHAGGSDGGVDNDALALLLLDAHGLFRKLLHDEGRNVGLEGSRSETGDEKTENEDTERRLLLLQNIGDGRDDEDGVTEFSNEDRVEDCLVATEVGIGNPSTEERADVDPERVESGQGETNLLAETQTTRLSLVAGGVEGSTSAGKSRLGDEVGVDNNGTIVRHALAQLDETNGEDLPRNHLGDTTQSAHLLLGGEVIPVGSKVAFLESSPALGEKVGGRRSYMVLGVSPLGVARTIDEGVIQAGSLLLLC